MGVSMFKNVIARILMSLIIVQLSVALTASAAGRSKKAKTAPQAPVELKEIAQKELVIKSENQSAQVLSTPATVRPKVEAIASPIQYSAFQVAASLTAYRPSGEGQIVNAQPYSLDSFGYRPLLSLELRWMPTKFESSHLDLGGYASLGYAFHNVKAQTLTGKDIVDTQLNTILTELGLAARASLSEKNGVSLVPTLGLGRATVVNSSPSAFANYTERVNYARLGVAAEKSMGQSWSMYVGYGYQTALAKETSAYQVQKNNFSLGLVGSVR